MCGRLWQTLTLNYLIRLANAGQVRNRDQYNGSYNMAPTHYIPAIRRYNRLMTNTESSKKVLGEMD